MSGPEPDDEGRLAATERLLVRLALDLHDGPLQQAHVLAQDLRVLREQVITVAASEHGPQLAGRFADIEALLAELHRDLRDLARSLEPRSLLEQPLADAVAQELAALARRTGIATTVELDGAFEELTASQRIALLRVLQEALSNIRQHSGARTVAVALRRDGDGGVTMEVRDDGRGFDAAAEPAGPGGPGGLGLEGMRERLRLLGGRLELESAPGGPSVVRAHLPAWQPPG